ncbi:hypothetical protein FKP32DRAFT_472665 [Trametes sanguinea]|nr:hypothetical protein FKP32DRAFT_472665 [Trametes sanguinea]
MAQVSPHPVAALGLSTAPTFSPQIVLVIGLALLFVVFCSGTAAIVTICHRRRLRRTRSQGRVPDGLDVERQSHNQASNSPDPRFLALLPSAALARSWSGSTAVSSSDAVGKTSLAVPPPVIAAAPSSRLRDSVLCKVLCQLSSSASDKVKNARPTTAKKSARAKAMEAAAAEYVARSANADVLDPDSDLSYPEWVRPHLPEIREQAKRQWTLYVPKETLPVPQIVIQSCDDESAPESPASIYSCDTASSVSEAETPPPMTPTLASPVSFYFPDSPSFSAGDYLQVPPPSFNAPREEEKSVLRNVSNFSGKTFALAAPPGRFGKMGKNRERRKADPRAQAQALLIESAGSRKNACSSLLAHFAESPARTGRGTALEVSYGQPVDTSPVLEGGMAAVGLGLQFQHKLDFQGSLDKAFTSSSPSGDNGCRKLSSTFSTAAGLDLAGISESSVAVADEALPSDGHDLDDGHASGAGKPEGDGGHSGRLARLVEAFDSSYSLASNESGQVKLSDVLDDYYRDHFDESFVEVAEEGPYAGTELLVQETSARRAVVVYAV